MKAKTVRGKGFRGVLDYALKKSGAEIVGGNMSGENARELAAEFGEVRRLREEIEKPVWHCALSLPEGERLSSEQWGKVATAFITRMGIDPMENQFVVVQHKDTTHDHAHIIVNRIKPDGSIWNHRNDVYKAITTTQELEGLFSLTKTPGREAKVFAQPSFTKGEIEKHKRTGEFPAKVPVSKAIAEVTAAGPMDPVTFIQAMEARGIEAVPNVSKTGRMNGFSFQYQGVALKGSDVGAAWKHLSEVVQYESARDAERLRPIKEGSKRRSIAIAGDSYADSPVAGGTGREGESSLGDLGDRSGKTVSGGSPDLLPVGESTRGTADGMPGGNGGTEEPGEKAPLEEAYPYSDGGDGISGWGDVADSVAVLARGQQPDVPTHPHPGEVSSVVERSRNLRVQAWYKQAACLDAPQYRVTVVDRDAERTAEYNRRWNEKHPDEHPRKLDDVHAINLCRKDGIETLWNTTEVVERFSTFEYYNVNRYDIYVTPMDPGYHHILLDDLTIQGVEYVKEHYAPCLIQASSANNYQAIVRVPKAEVSPDEQSAANLLIQRLNRLPKGCGGDSGISAPIHTFRMCGFSNKKPGRKDVRTELVLYRPGAVCEKAAAELAECREEIRKKRATAAAPRTTTEKKSGTVEIDMGSPTPFDNVFEREWRKQKGLAKKNVRIGVWQKEDDSSIDFRTCLELLKKGHGAEEIAPSFKRKSPGVAGRHDMLEDYVSRTLRKAGLALAEALEEGIEEATDEVTQYDGR